MRKSKTENIINKMKTSLFTYNGIKKNISFILGLTVLLFNLSYPFFALAVTPTMNIRFIGETFDKKTEKSSWLIQIDTSNLPNKTPITITLKKELVDAVAPSVVEVLDNQASYFTNSILEPYTDYQIIATTKAGLTETFSKKTLPLPLPDKLVETKPVDFKPISGTETGESIKKDVYTLLAPIGNFKTAPENIGDYFNTIFNIAIGLCAVLAVIMIVVGGVQYMGDESIFGKTEAKDRITKAIMGLLIALGSYALLNTINPQLLGGGGISINAVSAGIEEEEIPILSDDASLAPTKNSFNNCPGGTRIVQTKTVNFRFCSAYADKLQLMIAAAYNAGGVTLSGGGYRSYEEQIALRNKNCPAPKLTVPANSCKPQTAKPGTSNHEQGLAVDLKCNGTLINWDNQNPKFSKVASTKVCFDWLQKNAINYGFKNLPKENWHWSTGPNAGH